jgi:hypothetical protein
MLSVLILICVLSFLEAADGFGISAIQRRSCNRCCTRSKLNFLPEASSDSQLIQSTFDVFSITFLSRFFGQIGGNLLAALAVKYVYEYFIQGKLKLDSESRQYTEAAVASSTKASTNDIPLSAWLTLILCAIIDGIGDSSFFFPGVGEVEDVAWAPISAFLLQQIFGSNIVTGIDLVKEALPFTDFVPIAVIAWILKYRFSDSIISKYLGLTPTESEKVNK